jgi:Ran GTPase-activating protein (RanGAP) involved in mRNA processing and transport
MICNALLNCRGLRSILAEWNVIGLNSNVGLNALLKLVRNNPSIEKIDLKNNRIDHLTVEPICEIIRINPRGLKILDLKWNDLGEIGGRAILNAIQSNTFLKSLEVGNNRIS